MIQSESAKGDLLFHAVHGLFRVDEIIKQNQSGEVVRCYSLVPKKNHKMKTRIIVGVRDIDDSGFHVLVSLREANEILEYLGAGVATPFSSRTSPKAEKADASIPQTHAWGLAQTILSFSFDRTEVKDQRSRQKLERSAKGLVGELAFVFNMTLKETAVKVKQSLGRSPINQSVITALTHACED